MNNLERVERGAAKGQKFVTFVMELDKRKGGSWLTEKEVLALSVSEFGTRTELDGKTLSRLLRDLTAAGLLESRVLAGSVVGGCGAFGGRSGSLNRRSLVYRWVG